MGSDTQGRHGLFRCGAFIAARARRPPILELVLFSPRKPESLAGDIKAKKTAPHRGELKKIVMCCINPTGRRNNAHYPDVATNCPGRRDLGVPIVFCSLTRVHRAIATSEFRLIAARRKEVARDG
jgi:hypothetical protein